MPKKILVVDDEADIVMMVELRLKALGYDVITGDSGEAALKMVKQERPDLILLDVMMPPPNGFQVCRTLKDNPDYKSIPIIMLTAKSSESDKFWGTESGADAYITKPYNAEELVNQIQALLEK